MAKIVQSERLRRELDQVLSGVGEHDDPVEAVARLGARLILQQALEDEVSEFLGRERYERADSGGVIYRNGYEPRTVKTTSGAMELERPRVRNATELGFESRVLGKGIARTHALQALIIVGFLRGLSVRDVEALLEEALGEPIVGKSTVARICQDTRERYRAWCERDLSAHDLVYCYLDAIYLKLRPDDEPAEGVLVAWGLTLEGQKVLLGLALGSRESYESWLDFGRDLQTRGMHAPALIIADGAPGIWRPPGSCGRARSSSAAPSTRSATSPASCPSGCTARSRRATGPCSTTQPRPTTRRPGCSPWPASTGAPTRPR
jgi:putative transposase